ncbi:MAG: hypothetical protein K8H88_31915 [Sandaracinaceae bacterium]|nr:hypothetical protein [Sandaracinaceae bacterium]
MSRRANGRLSTRVGQALHGENQFFGHAVGAELLGRVGLTDLTALAITGRLPSAEQRQLLEEIATVLSSADPRIWLFKTTRLGACYGGMIAGAVTGMLCLHRALVGHMTASDAAALLVELVARLPDPGNEKEVAAVITERLATSKRLIGFGVPFRPQDERAVQLEARLRARGWTERRHYRALLAVSSFLRQSRAVEPNLGGCLAAALLDAGFAPDRIGPLVLALGQHTFLANAVEGAEQSPEILQRFPDEWVEYRGAPRRASPRARGTE